MKKSRPNPKELREKGRILSEMKNLFSQANERELSKFIE